MTLTARIRPPPVEPAPSPAGLACVRRQVLARLVVDAWWRRGSRCERPWRRDGRGGGWWGAGGRWRVTAGGCCDDLLLLGGVTVVMICSCSERVWQSHNVVVVMLISTRCLLGRLVPDVYWEGVLVVD